MQTGRQTITVDSVAAAKRANAKIIEGARKRLRPQKNSDVLSSSDEEMYNFAVGAVSDEAILRHEAYKRKNPIDKRIERHAQASRRLEEMQQRLDATNRKLRQAASEKLSIRSLMCLSGQSTQFDHTLRACAGAVRVSLKLRSATPAGACSSSWRSTSIPNVQHVPSLPM